MGAGQRIGYIRVSSVGQNVDRQLDGLELDRVFTDKASGSTSDRPALDELRNFVRDGDAVVVHSMDRLARNLDDLRRIVREMTDRGVVVEFVKEQLTFSGESNPMNTLLLSVMGAVAEFERELIRERQAEGILKAKKRGVYRGRAKALSDTQVLDLRERAAAGEAKAALAREFGVSRDTVYAYLARAGSR